MHDLNVCSFFKRIRHKHFDIKLVNPLVMWLNVTLSALGYLQEAGSDETLNHGLTPPYAGWITATLIEHPPAQQCVLSAFFLSGFFFNSRTSLRCVMTSCFYVSHFFYALESVVCRFDVVSVLQNRSVVKFCWCCMKELLNRNLFTNDIAHECGCVNQPFKIPSSCGKH